MFTKKSWKRGKKVSLKITSENSDSKEPYSALNLSSSGKHNSYSRQEKPREKSSEKKFSHDKQEKLCGSFHRAAPFVEHFMVLRNKFTLNQGVMC